MTAEALESMTDPGKFETLATSVLRELHPACKTLAHLGVNAAGKTIPNPIDGFCRVPGSSPPQYVIAAFTTVSAEQLERKWLLDAALSGRGTKMAGRTDGDLIKAAKEAAGIRKSEPTDEFIAYLCTNQRLSLELMQKVYMKGCEFGIEVCFLEQSQLRDFLDTNAVGQWLRQQYLGIDADQLSRHLLQHLGSESLGAYTAEKMLFPEIDQIIETTATNSAHEAIRGSIASLHLLVGPSGAGKTVIGRDVLRRHLEGGGLGLWIPNEVADRAISLSDAIEKVVRTLHPRVAKGAGHRALELAAIDQPLLLIIDDINRSQKTSATPSRIMGWCRSLQPLGVSGVPQRSAIRVVCPLWDSYWHPLRHNFDGQSWLRVQIVRALRRPEAVACLRASLRDAATQFSESQLEELAEHMRDDAILLGLFGRQLRNRPEISPKALSEDVIGNFVNGILCDVSLETHIPVADYVAALKLLAHEMIRQRSLYPQWPELVRWFSDRPAALNAIRHLAAQQHVCRIASHEHVERFEYRHDRILEYYLSLAAAEILQGTDAARELISDPFFVPFVGRALARIHASDAVLDWVTKRVPVALIAAIPYVSVGDPNGVLDQAHIWLAQWPSALGAVREDALDTLVAIQSPHVLKITTGIPEDRTVWEARLRNGDAVAGSNALSTEFFPRVNFPWLESLIEEAKFLHGGKLALELEKILTAQNLSNRVRNGALCLAGYLGDSRLANSVKIAWDDAADKSELLRAALWAAFRCAGDRPAELLGSMLPAIFDISDEGPADAPTARERILEDLAFALQHGVGDAVLRYLVGLGESKEEYFGVTLALLEKVDHPVAIGYTVWKLARSNYAAEQAGSVSLFAITWADQWRRRDQDSLPLSPASLDELRFLWTNENNPECVRTFAFSVWARYVPDLDGARSFLAEAPQGDGTVWHRALRGDREIAPEVAARLALRAHWLRVVPRVWCAKLEAGVESWLEKVVECGPAEDSQNDLCYELAQCLRDIPISDSLRLLLKHWNRIRFRALFIQVALYLGTDETRSLAKQSLRAGASEMEVFRYIDFFFGFRTEGLSDRLGLRQLESLRPYLHHLNALCLDEIIEYCHAHDYWGWALQHLRPECTRRIVPAREADGEQQRIISVTRRWFPTDQDLLAEFDGFENTESSQQAFSVWFWFERRSGRDITSERCFALLEQWVKDSPTPARCLVAAAIVRNRGQRPALNILRSHCDEEPFSKLEAIVSDAEYRVKRRSLA